MKIIYFIRHSQASGHIILVKTALNYMIDSWLNAVDRGEIIGVVLADSKKAFDLVDHVIHLT